MAEMPMNTNPTRPLAGPDIEGLISRNRATDLTFRLVVLLCCSSGPSLNSQQYMWPYHLHLPKNVIFYFSSINNRPNQHSRENPHPRFQGRRYLRGQALQKVWGGPYRRGYLGNNEIVRRVLLFTAVTHLRQMLAYLDSLFHPVNK